MSECKIGEMLVKLRTAKGLTQDEVAQSLSVSNKTVSKWENSASMPDLPMLMELSQYFGVTTDALLGISDGNGGIDEAVRSVLTGVDRKEQILRAFEMERAFFPAAAESDMFLHGLEAKSLEDAYPSDDMLLWRSQISASDFFKFTVASDAVNLSVTLLRNKENFAWLGARDEQDKIVKLFRFLSEEDVLSVLYFIHSTKCSRAFTADYISENSGISVERVSAILKSFCEVGDCRCMTAHLADGDVDVYECDGDGIILSLLSLAYNKMCGSKFYQYYNSDGCKMIGGK